MPGGRGGDQAGPPDRGVPFTLEATERAVAERVASLSLDIDAMTAVQNVYRAARAIRSHLERTVLAPRGLTWSGWLVLWVVWLWEEIDSRHVAAAAGISKGTLTGVARTLERSGLLVRRTPTEDARRVVLSLTPAAQELMRTVFPVFNEQETLMLAALDGGQTRAMTAALRTLTAHVQDGAPPPAG